jgi:CRP/FNR family transcriptional regulator
MFTLGKELTMLGNHSEFSCAGCMFQSPIFKLLSAEELERINENRVEVAYHPGETIIKQGTACTHVISFAQGMAKMYLEGDSRNVIFRLVVPGDFISGTGLFVNNRHHYTLTAIRDSRVCLIDSQQFIEVLRSNQQFWEEYLKHTQTRQIFYMDKLLRLSQKNSRGRIADVLLYLTKDIYKADKFEMDLSTHELAEMTSMSKDSVSKIVKEFCQEKIICFDDRFIQVGNLRLLEDISKKG